VDGSAATRRSSFINRDKAQLAALELGRAVRGPQRGTTPLLLDPVWMYHRALVAALLQETSRYL
jgi:hypothetical protein